MRLRSYRLLWTPIDVEPDVQTKPSYDTFDEARSVADALLDTGEIDSVTVFGLDGEVAYHHGEGLPLGVLFDPVGTAETNFWLDPYGDAFLAAFFMHSFVMENLIAQGEAPSSGGDHPIGWLRISTPNYSDINVLARGPGIWTQRQLDVLFDVARHSLDKRFGNNLMARVNRYIKAHDRVANPSRLKGAFSGDDSGRWVYETNYSAVPYMSWRMLLGIVGRGVIAVEGASWFNIGFIKALKEIVFV